ncbi:hypothetical protein Hanom_Chr09g00828941 [Helianthus anomalus]
MLRLKVSLQRRFIRRKSLEEAILIPLLRNLFLKSQVLLFMWSHHIWLMKSFRLLLLAPLLTSS